MQQPTSRNFTLTPTLIIYLIFMGGASALTYFIWDVGNLTSSLASAIFFGIMGGVSVIFHRRGEGHGFARLAKVWSVLAFLGLISHIFQVVRIHPALVAALIAFGIGAALYRISRRNNSTTAPAASQPVKEWQQLGPGAASLADQQIGAAREGSARNVPQPQG